MNPYLKIGITKKIKAGALLLVIGIALILFMLIGLYMLRKGLTHRLLSAAHTEEQLRYNIQSAISFLENKEDIQTSYDFSFFPDLGDSTTIKINNWGFFDTGLINSKLNNQNKKGIFLLGGNLGARDELPSLYHSDPDRYLSIGGFTYLGTNTYLPRYGIRKAYVNGVGYYRDSLVYGEQHQAQLKLPNLSEKILLRYKQFISNPSASIATISPSDDYQSLALKRSFFDKTYLIESDHDIDLRGISLIGNIIVHSNGNILIDSTSTIDQCILIGQTIEVNSNFKGRGQLLAQKSIFIDENCRFYSPSILSVLNGSSQGKITLEEQVFFNGTILLKSTHSELDADLKIENTCKIIGQIYCDAFCDFNGVLFGSLFTNGFIQITPNSFNQNYLANACIDIERMPAEYSSINIFDNDAQFKYTDKLY
nr:hypothetical protein [uncultured Draconibacterium sp.]